MPIPFTKRMWRRVLRTIFNPGWKARAKQGQLLRESVTRFEQRTIHRDLTPEILHSISDDELIQAIVDCVETRLPQGHVGVFPSGVSLPRGCIATYYCRIMSYGVWNGGFEQFIDGSGADAVKQTVEALQFFGLFELADVVIEAERRYARGESTSPCDDRHAELQPEAERQIIRFIRERPDEFTTTNAA
jgi:hypothetical protein